MSSENQELQRILADLSCDCSSVVAKLPAAWSQPAWIASTNGELIFGNTALHRSLNHQDAAAPETLNDFLHPDDAEKWHDHCQRYRQGAAGFTIRLTLLCNSAKNERQYNLAFQTTAVPLEDRDGKITAWIALCAAEAASLDEAHVEGLPSRGLHDVSDEDGSFHELANAVPHLVWLAERSGRVVYYSSQVTRFEGFTYLPDGSWRWDVVVHPDEREATVDAWKRAIETSAPYDFEHRVLMNDCTFRWHLSRAQLGNDGLWYGTATDIHELKTIQNRLRELYVRFTVALEASHVVVFSQDTGLRYTWIHNASHRYTADEVLGLRDVELLDDPEEAKMLEEIKQSVLDTGIPRRAEVQITRQGVANYFDLFVQLEYSEDGLVAGVTCAAVDITDRKHFEKELHLSEERFRKTFENAATGVAHVALDGRWLRVNQRFCELLGYSQDELLQKSFADVTHPEDQEKDWSQTRRLISGQISRYSMEKRYVRKDGQLVPVILTVSLIHDGKGNPDYFIAIAEDITLQKQSEDKLRDQDRRKEEFLAMLAHELRNPLAPIRTGLEVLKVVADDPELMEETRATMERQTLQLISIVDDLLDVSRISQGKLQLRKQIVNLNDIIRDALDCCKPLINRAGHDVSVNRPDGNIQLLGDPHRLTQILANLINNAVKYMKEPGTIRVSANCTGQQVEISVADTGIGIPAEMLEQIFEMFAQLEAHADEGYVGLGIGLTLVKSLTEMHGGSVSVQSDGDGKGSEFTVVLPLAMESIEPLHSERDVLRDSEPSLLGDSNAPPKSLRVLVVDDNVAAAKTLGIVIRLQGCVVKIAHDGHEAIEAASQFHPDVIFMDIGMPRMNGYEAAKQIRGFDWGQKPILIAITGWGQDGDRQNAKRAGFDYHVTKPAEPDEIKRLLSLVRR